MGLLKDFVVSSDLNRKVFEIIYEDAKNYNGNLKDRLLQRCEEVCRYGCVSGTVGELIYYSDTSAWFEEFAEEIAFMVDELCNETGLSINELVRDWDSSDPFCRGFYNRNLMAWLSFEETCNKLSQILEEEY